MRIQSMIAAAALATTALTAPALAQNDSLPSSWQGVVEHYMQSGDLGVWTSSGKTEGMWEGIPAGIAYTSVIESRLADDGHSILRSHTMRTADGQILSTGSGVTYWDEKSGTVKSSYSGFDTGEPFTGTSTLLGFGKKTDRWKYVETSRGKTTEYLEENTRTGMNERTDVVRKADGGEPWQTVATRSNPMASVLARFDNIGTWERVSDDGTRRVTKRTLGLDGRCIFEESTSVETDGSSVQTGAGRLWWDAGRATVCFHFLDAGGMSVTGEMISLTVEGDKATMVSRHNGTGGSGNAFGITLTQIVEGDTHTAIFTDFSSEGAETTPAWIGVPIVAKRIARQ